MTFSDEIAADRNGRSEPLPNQAALNMIFPMGSFAFLDRFRKPTAKIDYLTIELPASLNTEQQGRDFHLAIKGRIQTPQRYREHSGNWITIHDPHVSDLQWLLDHHPEAQILGIEIAVDFTPQDGGVSAESLSDMHRWLKTRMFPQRHSNMGQVTKRRYYEARTKQIVPDTLQTRSGNETVYWTNPKACEQVRLYVKTMDNGVNLDEENGQSPCVRIEATLFRGGCQNVGLYRIAELPVFADQMRRYLSPFMYVASGIRPRIKRTRTNSPTKMQAALGNAEKEQNRVTRAWNRFGAAWAGKHGYSTVPDTHANRLIGVALKGLRDELMRLKLTRKVAAPPDYSTTETPMITGSPDTRRPSYIEGKLSLLRQHDERSTNGVPRTYGEEHPVKHKVQPIDPATQTESEGTVCTP